MFIPTATQQHYTKTLPFSFPWVVAPAPAFDPPPVVDFISQPDYFETETARDIALNIDPAAEFTRLGVRRYHISTRIDPAIFAAELEAAGFIDIGWAAIHDGQPATIVCRLRSPFYLPRQTVKVIAGPFRGEIGMIEAGDDVFLAKYDTFTDMYSMASLLHPGTVIGVKSDDLEVYTRYLKPHQVADEIGF